MVSDPGRRGEWLELSCQALAYLFRAGAQRNRKCYSAVPILSPPTAVAALSPGQTSRAPTVHSSTT